MSSETRWSVILAAANGQPLAQNEFVRRYASVVKLQAVVKLQVD